MLPAWFRAELRHLLPCVCVFCGAVRGDLACNGCTDDLASHPHRRYYTRCAIALDAWRAAWYCRTCLIGTPDFDATVVIANHIGPLDYLVIGLKFRTQLPLADWSAAQLDNAPAAAPSDLPGMLLPVPLPPARPRSHGYDQAWEVARWVVRRLDIPAHAGAPQHVRDNVA